MAITEPISERIVLRIVANLKTITLANGYSQDVEVHRNDETGDPVSAVNKGATLTVYARAPSYDDKMSECGKDCFRMRVGIIGNLRHSDVSSTEVSALQGRLFADVHKVIMADQHCNGLAAIVLPYRAQEGQDNSVPAADVEVEVLYRTARSNPFSL